ncbi:MAG: hypothetical protein ACYCVD_02900 [Desulfitobacteriaceae bacterium]
MAISKIKSEMDKNKNNAYIQVVGEFLLQHLNNHPEDAEKILNPDKSIAKSLDDMRKAAEKKKVGNFAMFTPQEGFELVMKYFRIEASSGIQIPIPQAPSTVTAPPQEAKSAIDFDINLEDLL